MKCWRGDILDKAARRGTTEKADAGGGGGGALRRLIIERNKQTAYFSMKISINLYLFTEYSVLRLRRIIPT